MGAMSLSPAPLGPKALVMSDLARSDVSARIAYVQDDAGIDKALYLADQIEHELTRLARIGHSGVAREWLAPGLRLMVFGRYSIYFRVTKTETIIVRFLMSTRELTGREFQAPGI